MVATSKLAQELQMIMEPLEKLKKLGSFEFYL